MWCGCRTDAGFMPGVGIYLTWQHLCWGKMSTWLLGDKTGRRDQRGWGWLRRQICRATCQSSRCQEGRNERDMVWLEMRDDVKAWESPGIRRTTSCTFKADSIHSRQVFSLFTLDKCSLKQKEQSGKAWDSKGKAAAQASTDLREAVQIDRAVRSQPTCGR